MLPFVEPQFLGFVGHGARVEHAVVLDQAFEPIGPLAGDPVHHVATVGGAQCAGVGGVELGIGGGGVREAALQILERFATPVVADAVGEGLAVAGAAMEIDADHGVAGSGEQARIPAVAPAVAEAALRPTMDDERNRELAPKSGGCRGLELEAVDLVIAGALEGELFEADRVELGEQRAVDVGQSPDDAARCHAEQIVGGHDAVLGEDRAAIAGRDDVAGVAIAGETGDGARRGIDPPDRAFHRVFGGDQQAAAILAPRERARRTVPLGGQRAGRAGGEITQHDHLAIGFVAGAGHRDVGQCATIGRQRWQRIGPAVGRGEVDRLRGAVGGGHENVEIGRGRLDPPRFAQGEIDRAAVGGNVDLFASAEWLGRGVADEAAGDPGFLPEFSADDREAVEARFDAGLDPRVPVANEQLVIFPARSGRLGREAGRGAGEVGAVPNVGPDQHAAAVGADLEARNVGPEIGHHDRTSTERHAVELITAGDRGEIIDCPVSAEDGAVRALGQTGNEARGGGTGEVEHVQCIGALVRRHIGGRQREDRGAAIG